jgi:hypothetical protein
MTLIKGKQEFRTILDFSKEKISRNMVQQALRKVEVRELVQDCNNYTFIENDIIVGMYQIRLSFSSMDASVDRSRLREYGGFRISIYERKNKAIQNTNLLRDKRFKNQYWIYLNKNYDIRMKNLVDIILYLKRLNNLKMFL